MIEEPTDSVSHPHGHGAQDSERGHLWRCSCGKTHEDSFDACWSCGCEKGAAREAVAVLADPTSEVGATVHRTENVTRSARRPRSGRTVTLKDEAILDQWSVIVESAASLADEVLSGIQDRLGDADIPGNCTWDIDEVKSSGWFSKVRREFLIVRLEQFSDYRIYIAAREYGTNLDACWFLTVEPGFFKQVVSDSLTKGDWQALSRPKNILSEQDLRAWVTVVHHCVVDAVGRAMEKLGQDKSKIRRESKGILDVW